MRKGEGERKGKGKRERGRGKERERIAMFTFTKSPVEMFNQEFVVGTETLHQKQIFF